jgi:hypothetical protein
VDHLLSTSCRGVGNRTCSFHNGGLSFTHVPRSDRCCASYLRSLEGCIRFTGRCQSCDSSFLGFWCPKGRKEAHCRCPRSSQASAVIRPACPVLSRIRPRPGPN